MPAPTTNPPSSTESESTAPTPSAGFAAYWPPSRRTLLIVAIAFAIGLGLFVLVWFGDRDDSFYTVEPVARPDTAASEFDPLPAPMPAGRSDGASGMKDEANKPLPESQARLIERAPPPVATPAPMATDAPLAPGPEEPVRAGDAPQPIPTRMPPPDYPRQAFRRGVEGTVLVRADVGPDGVPTSVSLVRSSRSRQLDRAALDAVRRWRFDPARVDGHPTVGSVVIPIDFKLDRR